MNVREKVLSEAIKCVTRDRNSAYGDPEDNFQHIADLWNAQFKLRRGDFTFTAHDVGVAFCLLKIARMRTSPEKEDNYVDLAGYAACTADCAIKQQQRDNLKDLMTYDSKYLSLHPTAAGLEFDTERYAK